MGFHHLIIELVFRKARDILNKIFGGPFLPPSFISMTLDEDDVELANQWLNDQTPPNDHQGAALFENEFARWNASKHAFAFMAGRIALGACIHALNLKRGDEVILPTYTCVVVPNAFHYAGIKTVYADIELDTYGLDVSDAEKKITTKTKAILLHHLFGLVCRDYEALIDLAEKHNLKVIEDCAQATGAEYKKVRVGNRGDVAFFSSEKSKLFNTIEGGVVVTNDEGLADRFRKPQFQFDGFQYF